MTAKIVNFLKLKKKYEHIFSKFKKHTFYTIIFLYVVKIIQNFFIDIKSEMRQFFMKIIGLIKILNKYSNFSYNFWLRMLKLSFLYNLLISDFRHFFKQYLYKYFWKLIIFLKTYSTKNISYIIFNFTKKIKHWYF